MFFRNLVNFQAFRAFQTFRVFRAFQPFRAIQAFQAFRVFQAFKTFRAFWVFEAFQVFELFKFFELLKLYQWRVSGIRQRCEKRWIKLPFLVGFYILFVIPFFTIILECSQKLWILNFRAILTFHHHKRLDFRRINHTSHKKILIKNEVNKFFI